ncbi:Uncharacterised protein [Mycobacteroides abscessus subsp. abscessus]|nr:Uncharacterised protein [Mycobacteroides abscessus subsp. abscessus]
MKSTPTPGTTFMALSMSARVSLPESRSRSTASSLDSPRICSRFLPTTPSKTMLVALPSRYGPRVFSTTETIASTTMHQT